MSPGFSKKHFLLNLTVALSILLCSFFVSRYAWTGADGKAYTRMIDSDGKGYYRYLPDIFLAKNFGKQLPDERYIVTSNAGAVNKYSIGTAVAMFPFFCTGYMIADFKNYPLDGYSPPFQKSISVAGLFYLMIGLIFFQKLLKLYETDKEVIVLTTLLILFGTNLLVYSVLHPSFSHVYSFCFVSAFLFFTKKFLLYANKESIYLASFALGMIILIRPVNGLIVLAIPFLAGSPSSLKLLFQRLREPNLFIFCSLIFISILFLQCIAWYIQCGKFIVWSYGHEGFYFLHPQVLNVLFSFRKGLFIYTPMALLSLAGLFILRKRNRFETVTFLLFLCTLIYVISSWWNWYYGPSFGQRPFVEFYPVFGLMLALAIGQFRKTSPGKIGLALGTCFLFLNLVQSYQYHKNIIHADNMDFEKYSYVFLKTSDAYAGCIGGDNDQRPYGENMTSVISIKNDFEKNSPHFHYGATTIESQIKSVVCDFRQSEFNAVFELKADSTVAANHILYASLSFDRLNLASFGCQGPLMVVDISDSTHQNYYYYTFPLNEIPDEKTGTWKTFRYQVVIPKMKNAGDVLKIYPWNLRHQPFYLDNFEISLIAIN